MRRIPHVRLVSLILVLFLTLPVQLVYAAPRPLPDTILHARTVFIENETGFHELQYTLVLELSKWGRFELAETREKADLILRLDNGNHVHAIPDGQFPSGPMNAFTETAEIPKGHTRISLLDPKSNALLWSDTHRTDGGKVKNGHLLDGLRDAFESSEKAKH
ncbi:MAG TPA: hypothetical protein VMJ35_04420 [Dongiaceae bacterium]|nr:hypothetical protein [Dongiaceae bacterium]